MIILFKYCVDVENCESFRGFGRVSLLVKFRLNKKNFVKKKLIMKSLSLRRTC